MISVQSKRLMQAALRVLEFRCGLATDGASEDDVKLLLSCAPGERELHIPLDELAGCIIRRELQRERALQSRSLDIGS